MTELKEELCWDGRGQSILMSHVDITGEKGSWKSRGVKRGPIMKSWRRWQRGKRWASSGLGKFGNDTLPCPREFSLGSSCSLFSLPACLPHTCALLIHGIFPVRKASLSPQYFQIYEGRRNSNLCTSYIRGQVFVSLKLHSSHTAHQSSVFTSSLKTFK